MSDDRFSRTSPPPAETGVQAEPSADTGAQDFPDDPDRYALPGEPTGEERVLALMCHVGGYLTAFILPLVLWLVKRRDSAFVDQHGKESLNFQLFLTVAYLAPMGAGLVVGILYAAGVMSSDAAAISGLVCGGLVLLLGLYETVAVFAASIASLIGKPFRYPINVRFIR
jgi:uncharacterized Tic20 family protein